MKYLMIFFSVSVIVLMSLNVMAQDVTDPAYQETITVTGEKKICKELPCIDQHSKKACIKENDAEKQSLSIPNQKTSTKEANKEKTNLSFNFIYYILYKFKYIDIFELMKGDGIYQ